jgi:hypothetical protein
MMQCLLVVLPAAFGATLFIGTLFFIILSFLFKHVGAGGVYSVALVLSLVIIPPIFYELKKRAYQRTAFNFYEDYLDFQYFRFYINRRRGRVRYADIADVSQHASMLQEQQRLLTIDLYVPAMGLRQQTSFAGLRLVDVPRAQDYMTRIIDILEGRKPKAAPPPSAAQPEATSASAPASRSSPPPVTDG